MNARQRNQSYRSLFFSGLSLEVADNSNPDFQPQRNEQLLIECWNCWELRPDDCNPCPECGSDAIERRSMKTVYLVRSIVECERCDGAGVVEDPKWAEVTCPSCRGAGYHERDAVPLEVALQALGVNLVQLRRLLEVTQ